MGRQALRRDLARRRQDHAGHRQVELAPAGARRSDAHRRTPRRHAIAAVEDRRPHALAHIAGTRSGEAEDRERRQAAGPANFLNAFSKGGELALDTRQDSVRKITIKGALMVRHKFFGDQDAREMRAAERCRRQRKIGPFDGNFFCLKVSHHLQVALLTG